MFELGYFVRTSRVVYNNLVTRYCNTIYRAEERIELSRVTELYVLIFVDLYSNFSLCSVRKQRKCSYLSVKTTNEVIDFNEVPVIKLNIKMFSVWLIVNRNIFHRREGRADSTIKIEHYFNIICSIV